MIIFNGCITMREGGVYYRGYLNNLKITMDIEVIYAGRANCDR